jgi:molecular chaperone HtpG
MMAAETLPFQTETEQLLDLVVHSLYSNKEIFLRELISNASDSLDRLRFEAIMQPELLAGQEKLEIRLEVDSKARTLTVADTGIGMSREEVIANIGTIAHSGTRELRVNMERREGREQLVNLIGQFGVGFYSAFMVADEVTLLTRRAGESTATKWECADSRSYTISEAEKPCRGTSVTLRLKPVDSEQGIEDFTDKWRLADIVRRYSDFIAHPIICRHHRVDPEDQSPSKSTDNRPDTITVEDQVLNSMKPIWTRPKAELSQKHYAEFYKHIAQDWNEPMEALSFKAEGLHEYQALLFIPAKAPQDLYYHAPDCGLQLYARGVMVDEKCEDLLPRYLRFLRGVVDAADLPLHISRQQLQQQQHLSHIRKWLARRVLDTLNRLQAEENDRYLLFWQEFGRAVKEGVCTDQDNRERILPLVLLQSSNDTEKLTTLQGYRERMKPDQSEILYLTGESRSVLETSPHLEGVRQHGYEVLYLVDSVDELLLQHVPEFEGRKLKSLAKGAVTLGNDEQNRQTEAELKQKEQDFSDLLKALQNQLDAEVKAVRLSSRLTVSPACLIVSDHDYSPQLERLLLKGKGGGPKQRRILELNPDHRIVLRLRERHQGDRNDPLVGKAAEILFDLALLAEGSELPDPSRFYRLSTEVLEQFL